LDVSKIDFKLKKSELSYNPLIKFEVTSLWDSRYVNYEFTISKDKNFKDYKTTNTVYGEIYIDPNDYKDYGNMLYIRSRWYFNWIYTHYSNIISQCMSDSILCEIEFKSWDNFLFDLNNLSEYIDINLDKLFFKKNYKKRFDLIDLI